MQIDTTRLAMAALALLEDILNGRIRRELIFRDYNDFLAHDDDWLISRFRFPRAILLELCAELGPNLERETMRSHALPVPLQVLTTLGFLATGSFQRELADRSGISQSCLSHAMPAVWDGIIRLSTRYIMFPYDAGDQPNIKGTLRLFGTLAYSPYPPELDKSIHTFFISVRAISLFDAPTASLA